MNQFITIDHPAIYTIHHRNLAVISVIEKDYSISKTTDGSFWVMANNGSAVLQDTITINPATWCSAGHQKINVTGPAIIIENFGFSLNEKTVTMLSSKQHGQLSYIDGCSNSNLINPARNGDPCINYLFFPPGIEQTWHTHPSVRIGYVVDGNGVACIKNNNSVDEVELKEGTAFILYQHTMHRFATKSNQHMSLMVYHPDSEDGPRDEFNPMKSRTFIK